MIGYVKLKPDRCEQNPSYDATKELKPVIEKMFILVFVAYVEQYQT